MSVMENAQKLYQMIGEGQMLDAFEQYYDEDVVMIEATGETREGKDVNREYEQKWLESVEEVHSAGVDAITADEDNQVSMVETWMDLTFKDGQRAKIQQVARQKWDGDHIVEERFYYNPAAMSN